MTRKKSSNVKSRVKKNEEAILMDLEKRNILYTSAIVTLVIYKPKVAM